MQCRDAQFYLRLRRHAGDELGADVTGDLDHHVAGCAACAADSRSAIAFDRAVGTAMCAVAVPSGLRDKLMTLASVHRGGVLRRKVYQAAALAASVLVATGLAFGVFSATRTKIDTIDLASKGTEQYQHPDAALRRWLTDQKFPDRLPEPFDTDLLIHYGKETIQGKDVPVAVFRHPTDIRGFAKVYIFRDDGSYNLKELRGVQASETTADVINDPARFRGVQYVIVYTGPEGLKPFLRAPGTISKS